MSSARLRIGIDCGGTNTDAAVLDQDDRVLGWAKAVTTEDVLGGVAAAVRGALASARRESAEVAAMMLGTTQFVNATVQLQGLARVAVVRCRWRRYAVRAAPALLADLACQPGRACRLRPFCCCTLARVARKLLPDCVATAGCC